MILCLQYNQTCNCSSCRHTELQLIQKKLLVNQQLHKAQHILEKPGQASTKNFRWLNWADLGATPPLPKPAFWQALKHTQLLSNWQCTGSSPLEIGLELFRSQFPRSTYNMNTVFKPFHPLHCVTCLYRKGSFCSLVHFAGKIPVKSFFIPGSSWTNCRILFPEATHKKFQYQNNFSAMQSIKAPKWKELKERH